MGLKTLTAGLALAGFTTLFGDMAGAQQATPPQRPASAPSVKAKQYAATTTLAYVRSGNTQIDEQSRKGLLALAEVMTDRTSIEPRVAQVDIEQDDITLFPMLYWPVAENAPPLSQKAQEKVQSYLQMKGGHLIVFDLHNNAGEAIGSQKSLRTMLGRVSLKPLVKMGGDHVLTKTFYKVAHLRGSFDYDTVRVEEPGPAGSEVVSSVIIGENKWAGAWAGMTLPESSNERAQAIRAGINIVIYALTGNYKQDQAAMMPQAGKDGLLQKLDKK